MVLQTRYILGRKILKSFVTKYNANIWHAIVIVKTSYTLVMHKIFNLNNVMQ
jgi:hypothetical protein